MASNKRNATVNEAYDLNKMIMRYHTLRIRECMPDRVFTEEEMEVDEETGELVPPFVMPLSSAEMANAIALIKHNNITVEPSDDELNDLKDEFDEEFKLKREQAAKDLVSLSVEETEQQAWLK